MNVALLLLGVTDEYCGGAERFFADFYDHYKEHTPPKFKLLFFTDKRSFKVLKKLKKLNLVKHVLLLNEISNRFKNTIEGIEFITKIIFHRIKIIHVTNYGISSYNRLYWADRLPSLFRPKIVINIVDNTLHLNYLNPDGYKHYGSGNQSKYSALFNTIRIDGIYSWYEVFKKFVEENDVVKKSKPLVHAIKTRYADYTRFKPAEEKRNEIVFAARLEEEKFPMMFIEGIEALREMSPKEIMNWKFFVFGKGPLEKEIMEKIEKGKLSDLVTLNATPDLSMVFNYSKCFVSVQEIENFPSLSMNEAMLAGNAIIARNVGQTYYFVKDGLNGMFLKEETSKGLAECMKYYIEHPEVHLKMQQESIRLTNEVHTVNNFISELENFWQSIAVRPHFRTNKN